MRAVNNVCYRLVRSGIVQSIYFDFLRHACVYYGARLHAAYILFAEEVKISVNASVYHAGAYPRLGILILLFAGR